MRVKVITDSTSDLPADILSDLDVSTVPLYLRFGESTYRDGIDMNSDEFYARLVSTPVHPTTSQPAPEDFLNVYKQWIESSSAIVSIHISARMSGTCNSAQVAKSMLGSTRPIEIVDSRFTSAALGLVTIAAARVAKQGGSLAEVLVEAKRSIDQVKAFALFNTMKYLALGGRVPKGIALAADFVDVKPILTFKDGELVRAGFVRTLAKGMDRLYEHVAKHPNIQDMAIVHSSVPDWASQLKTKLASVFPAEKIRVSQLGPALGVHGGKGVLIVSLRQSV